MTDADQYLLELVNRARLDPIGELSYHPLVSDLNQGLSPPSITSTPKQPLTSVQELFDAAELHSIDQRDNNFFSHFSLNGDTPRDRAETANYATHNTVSENLNWATITAPFNAEAEVIKAHQTLFNSSGHRQNLLNGNKDESGFAIRFGLTTPTIPNPPFDGSTTFNAGIATEKFGERAPGTFASFTGVVFDDSVVADDFYNIGESEGGIIVSALNLGTGVTYQTTSGPSGGYQIAVPAGWYTVTASGDGLTQTMVETLVNIGDENVKVDFNTSLASSGTGTGFDDLVGLDSTGQLRVGESDGTSLTPKTYGFWSGTVTEFGTGDFNGDGLQDAVSLLSDGRLKVAISTGISSFIVPNWGVLSPTETWTDFTVADFDGDGKDDVLARADFDGSWWVSKSDGNSFQLSHIGTYVNSIPWSFVTGDFNGDGKEDIAGRAATNGSWWVGISDGNTISTTHWGTWDPTHPYLDISVGDFDGDGLDDIAGRLSNSRWWVAESTGSDFFSKHWGTWTQHVNWLEVSVGDFDGDGDDDIAGRASNNGQWWVASANPATRTFSNQLWGTWPTFTTWDDVHAFDFNDDGRSDLIGRAGNGQWWILESNGVRFLNTLGTSWAPGTTWIATGAGNFN